MNEHGFLIKPGKVCDLTDYDVQQDQENVNMATFFEYINISRSFQYSHVASRIGFNTRR